MLISYDSIGQVCVTCMGSGPQINSPCKISTSNTIAICVDGDPIDGVVVARNSNLSTVAIRGFVTLPYFGEAPTCGYCPLAAAGPNKVKVMENAHQYQVFQVDTLKKTVTFYL